MRIKTYYDPPPIPTRSFDWSAIDYDNYCCPECASPMGSGATEHEAIDDLLYQLEEKVSQPKISRPKCPYCGAQSRMCEHSYVDNSEPGPIGNEANIRFSERPVRVLEKS